MLTDEFWSKLTTVFSRIKIYNQPDLRSYVEGMLYRIRVGCPWRDGSGLNVCLGMNINPELYLVDQEANDNIVYFFKLRKTNGFSGQPFDPCT